MQWILELILGITVFCSVIPAIHMLKDKGDQKYQCLRYLLLATFFWSILITLERFSSISFIVYYAGMLGFVFRLLFTMLMMCTIFQYANHTFPKTLKILFGILLCIDFVIALTNSSTQWFLNLSQTDLQTFHDLYAAEYGSLFIYHLILSYVIAIAAIVLLFVFLGKQRGVRQYREVTITMASSIVIVVLFNMIQLFNRHINVNLTYISLVIVAYVLYDVIFKKDMVFNLRASGRSEILANMRELYILTDSNGRIVEVSPSLLEKYDLSLNDVLAQPFDAIEAKLRDRVTLYSDYNMNEDDYENKDHYHLREKDFKLKGMNESGHMILLYDETKVYSLLRELNELSNYDAMTGLNNRNYIEHKIKSIHDTKNIGVISLDLNGLKVNNDYLGHERGDFLLKSLANEIKKTFRDVSKKDIARIGGDEFVIFLYDIQEDFLKEKIEQFRSACLKDRVEETISVSIGSAYDQSGANSIYALIQQADQNMYEMKVRESKKYKDQLMEYIQLKDRFIR